MRAFSPPWTTGVSNDSVEAIVASECDAPGAAAARFRKLHNEIEHLRWKVEAYQRELEETGQALGKALGYPWYKDDQKNFPGATAADGVCIGEHVPATLAAEAAHRLEEGRLAFAVVEAIDAWQNQPSRERRRRMFAARDHLARWRSANPGHPATKDSG